MADDIADVLLLRDATGACYAIPREVLERHRLPDAGFGGATTSNPGVYLEEMGGARPIPGVEVQGPLPAFFVPWRRHA